ncbi:hypothetical protein K2173_023435 [Erythroxylum novogranatense]|uniref:Homeobox domain-containing protein n=1 Tax=Erythroxylum novogranatense TaxID=1862640 RepID=A0AAV8TY39_9ROSI|nr:hypothetical protein K2173_023435 [Erythroxylum novogranatense]
MCLFNLLYTFYSLRPASFHFMYIHLPSLVSLYLKVFVLLASLCCLFVLQAIMDSQQQQPHQQPNEDNNGGAKGSFLCRQSSTRWTPTTDQIRILKDLYYNTGLRSPNAEQIQRISARLRQYGKIEGKNVFYWFQNHKARERQKKKFTTDVPMQQRTVGNAANLRPEDCSFHSKYLNIGPGSSSATIRTTLGQTGSYSYGSVTMEKSFRECSMSAGASNGVGGESLNHHNYGWVGIDSYGSVCASLFEKRMSGGETLDDNDQQELEDGEAAADIETLPLFPMHREDINGFCSTKHNVAHKSCYHKNCYGGPDEGYSGSDASLELSLNSLTGQPPESL